MRHPAKHAKTGYSSATGKRPGADRPSESAYLERSGRPACPDRWFGCRIGGLVWFGPKPPLRCAGAPLSGDVDLPDNTEGEHELGNVLRMRAVPLLGLALIARVGWRSVITRALLLALLTEVAHTASRRVPTHPRAIVKTCG